MIRALIVALACAVILFGEAVPVRKTYDENSSEGTDFNTGNEEDWGVNRAVSRREEDWGVNRAVSRGEEDWGVNRAVSRGEEDWGVNRAMFRGV